MFVVWLIILVYNNDFDNSLLRARLNLQNQKRPFIINSAGYSLVHLIEHILYFVELPSATKVGRYLHLPILFCDLTRGLIWIFPSSRDAKRPRCLGFLKCALFVNSNCAYTTRSIKTAYFRPTVKGYAYRYAWFVKFYVTQIIFLLCR